MWSKWAVSLSLCGGAKKRFTYKGKSGALSRKDKELRINSVHLVKGNLFSTAKNEKVKNDRTSDQKGDQGSCRPCYEAWISFILGEIFVSF